MKNSVKFTVTRIFSNCDGFYILLRYILLRYYSFIIQNIRVRIKLLKNKNFLLKRIHALLSKDQRNKFPHCFFMDSAISFSDENIEYSKSISNNVQLRVKSLKNSNFLLNRSQTSI